MNANRLPKTDSIHELASFWDTHDLTDFEDQLQEVNEPVFERKTQRAPGAAERTHKPAEKFSTRSKHHTAWAGVLATAAELSRRHYDVTITLGNTPTTDLLAAAADGSKFRVEVKSTSTANFILIRKSVLEEKERPDLFFVIVLVPRKDAEPCRFFVMSHADVRAAWKQTNKITKTGKTYKPGFEGLNWGTVTPYEQCWEKLPGAQQRLAS
jgi:hypothetical protein